MNFDDMTPLQRRLHNAACVLDAEGDEFGFVALLRETIDALATTQTAGVLIEPPALWVEPKHLAEQRENAIKAGYGMAVITNTEHFDGKVPLYLTPNAEAEGPERR